jgi:hypothetical protein
MNYNASKHSAKEKLREESLPYRVNGKRNSAAILGAAWFSPKARRATHAGRN